MMGVNPWLDQVPHGELLKRQLEQDGVVLEEVEAVAGDLAAALEIDQVEHLADLDVVFGGEVEGAGRAHLAQLAAFAPRSRRWGRRGG